jgi:putative methyltransferase
MSQLYSDAARVVRDVLEHKKGLGSNFKNTAVFALATETLRFHGVLEEVVRRAGVLADKEAKKTDRHLLLVLVYELLLGEAAGDIKGGGGAKGFVMRHRARLVAELARLKVQRGAASNEELLPPAVALACFARLNRAVCSLGQEEAAAMVGRELGLACGGAIDPGRDWERLVATQATHFYWDAHVPDLLVFGPAASLGRSGLVEKGIVVLQQKASCFPAWLVCRDLAVTVAVDACAAPGNKTAQLAALLGPRGRVWATEKDPQRSELLRQRLAQLGCAERVTCEAADFLSWNGPGKPVEVAVVDPSCSGSGMVQRGGPQRLEPGRLEGLAQFQTSAVRRALALPGVARVVYSTCSVHEQENEEVVRAVLRSNPDFELATAFPEWEMRGHGDDCVACVRVDPATHRTIGFFVAVFQRRQLTSSSSSCHLVNRQAITSSSSTGVPMVPVVEQLDEEARESKAKRRRLKKKKKRAAATVNTS